MVRVSDSLVRTRLRSLIFPPPPPPHPVSHFSDFILASNEGGFEDCMVLNEGFFFSAHSGSSFLRLNEETIVPCTFENV